MLVYRLEYEDGKGIYSGSVGFLANRAALGLNTTEDYIHPAPEHDEGLRAWWEGPWKQWNKKKQDWHHRGRQLFSCGFGSEKQMLDWFPAEGFSVMVEANNEDWRARKVQVSVYQINANKVRKGTHQVMFRKEDATLVEVRSLEVYAA
jgi:hypothetical protein